VHQSHDHEHKPVNRCGHRTREPWSGCTDLNRASPDPKSGGSPSTLHPGGPPRIRTGNLLRARELLFPLELAARKRDLRGAEPAATRLWNCQSSSTFTRRWCSQGRRAVEHAFRRLFRPAPYPLGHPHAHKNRPLWFPCGRLLNLLCWCYPEAPCGVCPWF
jgi:hypothetical protein